MSDDVKRCEVCQAADGEEGAWSIHDYWHDLDSINGMKSDTGWQEFGFDYPQIVKIKIRVMSKGLHRPTPLCQRHFSLWIWERNRTAMQAKISEAARIRRGRKLHHSLQEAGIQHLPLEIEGDRDDYHR